MVSIFLLVISVIVDVLLSSTARSMTLVIVTVARDMVLLSLSPVINIVIFVEKGM